jgi:hypothetical protein
LLDTTIVIAFPQRVTSPVGEISEISFFALENGTIVHFLSPARPLLLGDLVALLLKHPDNAQNPNRAGQLGASAKLGRWGRGQNTAGVRYVKPYQRRPQGRAQTIGNH